MSMSNVPLHPDVEQQYKNNFQTATSKNTNTRPWYFVYKIVPKSDRKGDDEIQIQETGPIKDGGRPLCKEVFDEMKSRYCVPDEACYILFDYGDSVPGDHVFIAWVPDTATIKQRMLYAASKSNLVKKFSVKKDIQANDASELEEVREELDKLQSSQQQRKV